MSGVSRPAGVANAAPASGQSRLSSSLTVVCVHGGLRSCRPVAVFVLKTGHLPPPYAGRRAGRRVIGPSSQAAPHCRSRSVGGAWGVGGSGAAAGLPRTSVPVRWAVRGEVGPRVEPAACPGCRSCRCHAGHFGALQKPELREPQDWAEASDTERLWGLLPYVRPAICGRDTHRCASQGLRSEASARAVRGGRGRCVNGCTRGYRVGGFPGCV